MSESAQNDAISTPLIGDAAQADLPNRIKEHESLIRLIDMVYKDDALDYKIIHVINQELKEAPTSGKISAKDADQVEDILLILTTIEDILAQNFFARAPLRRSLGLHPVNPVSDEEKKSVPLSELDRDNARLIEQVWFLLLIGTSAQEIGHSLQDYRASRLNPPARSPHVDIGEFASNQFRRSGAQARQYAPANHDIQCEAVTASFLRCFKLRETPRRLTLQSVFTILIHDVHLPQLKHIQLYTPTPKINPNCRLKKYNLSQKRVRS